MASSRFTSADSSLYTNLFVYRVDWAKNDGKAKSFSSKMAPDSVQSLYGGAQLLHCRSGESKSN